MKWYFEYFDEIFAAGRDYGRDVELLAAAGDINGKSVIEVGSGTGNHVAAMLDHDPSQIEAYDVSPDAARMLRERFAGESRVLVCEGDGFGALSKRGTVAIFYCILQRYSPEEIAAQRLLRIFRRANLGVTWFEWMDTDIHNDANVGNGETALAVGHGHISLRTFREPVGTRIRYKGMIDGKPVLYEPVIENLPMATIEDLGRQAGARLEVHYLSKSKRKAMVRISS